MTHSPRSMEPLRSITRTVPAFAVMALLLAPAAGQPPPGTGTGTGTGTGDVVAEGPDDVIERALAIYPSEGLDAAAESIDDFLRLHPDEHLLPVMFSRRLADLGRRDDADAYLEAFSEGHPDNHFVAFELGSLHLRRLEYRQAIPYFEAVPPAAGITGTLARLNLGKAYRAVGRWSEARDLYAALTQTPSAVFAEAALCEIEMADGGLEACRDRLSRLEEAGATHPSLVQARAILAYLDGRFAAALTDVQALEAQGRPGSRTQALTVLIPLADGQLEAAEAALAALAEITVRGEHDVLEALIGSAAGRPDQAASALERARQANPLFSTPAAAARVLLWRPELAEQLAAIDTARAEGTGPPPPSAPATGHRQPAGCCQSVAGRERPGGGWVLLAVMGVALMARRRSGLKECRDASSRPTRDSCRRHRIRSR